MHIRFYIDPASDAPHIYNHDVSESEVEDVLGHPLEDRPGHDGSRIAIGQPGSRRFIRVIYVADADQDSVFVITAYELRGKPLVAFRRRRRRKHR